MYIVEQYGELLRGNGMETHRPCESCGSSDALTVYEDGHKFCFSCGKYFKARDDSCDNNYFKYKKEIRMATETKQTKPIISKDKLTLTNIRDRGLSKETCTKYGYYVSDTGRHIAEYRNINGEVVGQKVRRVEDKAFSINGTITDSLYGMHLFDNGKKLIITEGEIDCLSYAQVIDCKYPVVSIPNGVNNAKKVLLKNLDYLSRFEEIVLMFDMDEQGIKAAKECAEAIAREKVYIVNLPLKDANEMLMAGRVKELKDSVWSAHKYAPAGIVTVDDLMEDILKPIERGINWCFKSLTELTYGRFMGAVYGLGAGTGAGKTDFITQQMAYDLVDLGMSVGVFSFEQRPTETVKRIASKVAHKRLYLATEGESNDELMRYIKTFQDRLYLYDSFGTAEWPLVETTIRYLHGTCNVNIFYIDNLTFLTETGNAKDSLENIMKKMSMLANSLQVIIIFVSHLTTPAGGESHEEGARISGRSFKDSRTIEHLAHGLYGLERNQQHEDAFTRNTTTIRIIKDRLSGDAVGETVRVFYDRETGIMREVISDNSMFSMEG